MAPVKSSNSLKYHSINHSGNYLRDPSLRIHLQPGSRFVHWPLQNKLQEVPDTVAPVKSSISLKSHLIDHSGQRITEEWLTNHSGNHSGHHLSDGTSFEWGHHWGNHFWVGTPLRESFLSGESLRKLFFSEKIMILNGPMTKTCSDWVENHL